MSKCFFNSHPPPTCTCTKLSLITCTTTKNILNTCKTGDQISPKTPVSCTTLKLTTFCRLTLGFIVVFLNSKSHFLVWQVLFLAVFRSFALSFCDMSLFFPLFTCKTGQNRVFLPKISLQDLRPRPRPPAPGRRN